MCLTGLLWPCSAAAVTAAEQLADERLIRQARTMSSDSFMTRQRKHFPERAIERARAEREAKWALHLAALSRWEQGEITR